MEKYEENIILAKDEHRYACREDSWYYFKIEKIVISLFDPTFIFF